MLVVSRSDKVQNKDRVFDFELRQVKMLIIGGMDQKNNYRNSMINISKITFIIGNKFQIISQSCNMKQYHFFSKITIYLICIIAFEPALSPIKLRSRSKSNCPEVSPNI
ncbi:hypothetical protein RF11_02042 [Thelohanellus kitauei]|uniref:Uncharacterized protein n=1 Tax=Thelohanellus kitauei TaxID=669202 RepID=A0A0C2MGV1_THEKT|nr:hypothetical protein RF11_02042 [Thelohanellus kitauei]